MQSLEQDVILRAARGDMEAFEKIYKYCQGFVYSVAYRVVNNSEGAKDITQEVFLKIHKYLKNFQFRSSFKTWVYRITVNTAINVCRKRGKELLTKTDYEEVIKYVGVGATARDEVQTKEVKEKIGILLNALKPDHRVCIVLREIEGLSYEEIAKTLRIKINTVRSRLKRARLSLLAIGSKEAHYEVW